MQTEDEPLLTAIEKRDPTFHIHLKKGGVNKKNRAGMTALILACKNGDPKIVAELLQHRADPNAADNYGNTPLHWAIGENHLTLIPLLIAHGADPEQRDGLGRQASEFAKTEKRKEVEALLTKKPFPWFTILFTATLLTNLLSLDLKYPASYITAALAGILLANEHLELDSELAPKLRTSIKMMLGLGLLAYGIWRLQIWDI